FAFDGPNDPLKWEYDEIGEIPDYMQKLYDGILKRWEKSQSRTIKIKDYKAYAVDSPEYKASVLRGYKNFIGETTNETPNAKGFNCVSCHVNFGRQSMFKWDSWGTLVRPNNLTNGIYRGGRRPIDLYYRIHSGINGSNMTPFGMHEEKSDQAI